MTITRERSTIGVLFCLFAGCTTQGPLQLPPHIPAAFEQQAAASVPEWPGEQWYRGFGSGQLDRLIERAAAGNWDLAGARARVAQADARARQAGAAILPSVDADANGAFLAGRSSAGAGHETDWSALLSASYEIDFWGRNRAAADSAVFLAAASRAQRDTFALTLLAGVADGYFQVLALRERLAVAHSSLDAAQGMLQAVQQRVDAGSAGPLELAQQKSALSAAASAIPQLEQQESEARAALALLTGNLPEGFEVGSTPLDALSEPVVAAGLPSELLTRRPDIFAAEADLKSAHADLAAARAAMLPSVTLTAAAGAQNPALNAAVLAIPGAGPTVSLGGTLTQALFDHGRLKARRAEAQAREEELIAAYRAAIAASFADVENALSAIRRLNDARQSQLASVAQDERAFEGARLRYAAGSSDYLTMLETQRTLYAARDQFIQYKLARLQALVGLCKALGGGWTERSS